jgi:hypothetical protein
VWVRPLYSKIHIVHRYGVRGSRHREVRSFASSSATLSTGWFQACPSGHTASWQLSSSLYKMVTLGCPPTYHMVYDQPAVRIRRILPKCPAVAVCFLSVPPIRSHWVVSNPLCCCYAWALPIAKASCAGSQRSPTGAEAEARRSILKACS